MGWLDKVTPLNLLEEKQKFFADQTYNPQFIYEEPLTMEYLTKFGSPQPKYLELAKKILQKTFHGRNEKDLMFNEGARLSQDEVTRKFETFLEMHGLQKKISNYLVIFLYFTCRRDGRHH